MKFTFKKVGLAGIAGGELPYVFVEMANVRCAQSAVDNSRRASR